MKKSLQTCVLVFSLFMVSCHKESLITDDNIQQELNKTVNKTSNMRGDVKLSSGGVTPECTSCMMTYPDNSNLPRSGAIFSESDVLVAAEPGQTTCGSDPKEIKVWYSDEHPISLGVRQVIIKTKSGTTITNYPVTPSPQKSAGIAIEPQIGATDQTGDNSGNDVGIDGGRPLWPTLYITDISNDITSRAGDWQQGTKQNPSVGYPPNKICGMWKAAVRIVDKTTNPVQVSLTMDADPQYHNFWNLGGGQTPPVGTVNEKYGAMVAWDVSKLKAKGVLVSGHIYRLQFMVHDGDQNKTGGDVGESCTTLIMPNDTEPD